MTITILGGAGKTGRRIATRLTAAGHDARLASRSTSPAFDWADEATYAPALEGAEAVYIAYAPDVSVPEAAGHLCRLGTLALELGVRRVVLLSGRGEPGARASEAALAQTGVALTVLRCSWFAQNFTEDFLAPDETGVIALPAGDVPEPFVDVDDIAEVAVAALTQDGHAGEVYELTGPRALTFAEAATALGVTYVDVPMADWVAGAREAGLPEDVVGALVHVFGETLDGRNSEPQDGIRRALGREPRSFEATLGAAWTS